MLLNIITARKRSLRRLCYHRYLSVHGGGVSTPLHAGIHPPGADTPWELTPNTPLGADTRHPPGSRHTPRSRHPPEQTFPPRADTPPAQCMLGDTGNKRTVRILLKCILVVLAFALVCNARCCLGSGCVMLILAENNDTVAFRFKSPQSCSMRSSNLWKGGGGCRIQKAKSEDHIKCLNCPC